MKAIEYLVDLLILCAERKGRAQQKKDQESEHVASQDVEFYRRKLLAYIEKE